MINVSKDTFRKTIKIFLNSTFWNFYTNLKIINSPL